MGTSERRRTMNGHHQQNKRRRCCCDWKGVISKRCISLPQSNPVIHHRGGHYRRSWARSNREQLMQSVDALLLSITQSQVTTAQVARWP